MSELDDKLAELWLRNRPVVEERLATLKGALTAVGAGGLSEAQRKEAQSAAHKLAGALGMYGYDEGTRIARELEELLESARPDGARFGALLAELRAAVFPQG